MVEAWGPFRSAICFRSILSRQNGLNRHMEQTKSSVYPAAFRQPGDSALASNLGFCRPLARPPRKSKIHGVGNPWGGKSMGGKFLEHPWTNPGFLETQISAKSQGLKTSWPVFFRFLKYLEICIMFRYWIFDAVPVVVLPEFFFRKESGIGTWRQYWENSKHNIEKCRKSSILMKTTIP